MAYMKALKADLQGASYYSCDGSLGCWNVTVREVYNCRRTLLGRFCRKHAKPRLEAAQEQEANW